MRFPLLSEWSDARKTAALTHQDRLLTPENIPCEVQRITVIGGASIGLELAQSFALNGIAVLFLEDDAASQERAQHYLNRNLGGDQTGLLQFSTDPAQAIGSDMVLDRTLEPIPRKLEILNQLASCVGQDALIVTNVAGDDLCQLAHGMPYPEQVLGVQVFAPVQHTRIVELAAHAVTSSSALMQARGLFARLGKVAVMSAASGFISDRLILDLLEAADTLLMDGSTPWDIDEAMTEFGYAIGIYEAQDLIGTDVAYALRQRYPCDPKRRYIPIADRAVQEGRLGKKASVGWYRYPGGGGRVIDPLVEDLCREEAWFAGIVPRSFTADEIRKRLLLAQINSAAWALSRGIGAGDLDRISTQALGLPPRTGGILYFANHMDMQALVGALSAMQSENPMLWAAAPALVKAAKIGGKLRDAVPGE